MDLAFELILHFRNEKILTTKYLIQELDEGIVGYWADLDARRAEQEGKYKLEEDHPDLTHDLLSTNKGDYDIYAYNCRLYLSRKLHLPFVSETKDLPFWKWKFQTDRQNENVMVNKKLAVLKKVVSFLVPEFKLFPSNPKRLSKNDVLGKTAKILESRDKLSEIRKISSKISREIDYPQDSKEFNRLSEAKISSEIFEIERMIIEESPGFKKYKKIDSYISPFTIADPTPISGALGIAKEVGEHFF